MSHFSDSIRILSDSPLLILKHGGAKKLVLELFIQGIKVETVLALREIYENDYESQVCFPV